MESPSNFSLQQFHELCFYTLSHPDKAYFIHQHAVDAWQVQSAPADAKPIGIVFGLVGMYLMLEKGYTGKAVQEAHMRLAQHKQPLPQITLPDQRGTITIADVLLADPGEARDATIAQWCQSVWQACEPCHAAIAEYLAQQGF